MKRTTVQGKTKTARKDRDALRVLFALVFIILASVASVDGESPAPPALSKVEHEALHEVQVKETHKARPQKATEPLFAFRLKKVLHPIHP